MRAFYFSQSKIFRFQKVCTKLCLMLFCMALLGACGFHIRGQTAFPFKSIYINRAPNQVFAAQLTRLLRSNKNISVVQETQQAEVVLNILRLEQNRNTRVLDNQGQVTEYELYTILTFEVTSKDGQILIPQSTIQVTRNLPYNTAETLAREGEATMLYQNMQTDIINQLIRRLSAVRFSSSAEQAP